VSASSPPPILRCPAPAASRHPPEPCLRHPPRTQMGKWLDVGSRPPPRLHLRRLQMAGCSGLTPITPITDYDGVGGAVVLQCSIFVSIEFDCEFLSLNCEFLITSMVIMIVNSNQNFWNYIVFFKKTESCLGPARHERPNGLTARYDPCNDERALLGFRLRLGVLARHNPNPTH
jgi:hypothetical protein